MSLKRKNEDEEEFIEGISNSRKRAKLEEIIFKAISENEKSQANFSEDIIADKCNKLVTSIRLKNKYKYYCKSHNVTYLIDSVREEKKQNSKQNRNNLVQSFRSLAVSTDTLESSECDDSISNLDKNDNSSTSNQADDVKENVFKKPVTPIRRSQKRKASDSPSKVNENKDEAINPFKRFAVRSAMEETALNEHQHNENVIPSTPKILKSHEDENGSLITPKLSLSSLPKLLDGTVTMTEDSEFFDYYPTEMLKNKSKHLKRKKKKKLTCKIISEDEGDSFCEPRNRRRQLNQLKKYRMVDVNSFTVMKNPEGGNIIFQKRSDYFETDDDANDSVCECNVYDSLMSESSHFEDSDSSSEDELCTFTG